MQRSTMKEFSLPKHRADVLKEIHSLPFLFSYKIIYLVFVFFFIFFAENGTQSSYNRLRRRQKTRSPQLFIDGQHINLHNCDWYALDFDQRCCGH